MWYPTSTSNELYHHGILGQSWGHRNGPPYPLDSSDYSAAEKKAARKAARKERSATRKAKRAEKKAIKVQKKADKAEAKRQKILREGNIDEVRKLKGNISNSEYQEVFKRLENEQKLAEFGAKKKITTAKKINAAKSVVSDLNATSDAALKMYNRGAAIWNEVAKRKHWEPQNLPIIEVKGDKNKNNKDDKDDD